MALNFGGGGMMTPEDKLAKYWEDNPGTMEQAMQANPEAWGFEPTPAPEPFSPNTQLTQGESSEGDINNWWTEMNSFRRQRPEEFSQWEQDNPEMAIRWNARASNKGQNYGEDDDFSRKAAKERGKELAGIWGQERGLKEGQAIAHDFDTFDDVSSNWGKGDFWKVGTPQSIQTGLDDFAEENPAQAIAAAALMAVAPYASGALVTAGYTTVQAAAIVAAGSGAVNSALAGGDVTDILKGAAIGGLTSNIGGLVGSIPGLDKVGSAIDAQNFAGSALKGASQSVVKQAINDGEISLADAMKAGLIKSGMDTLADLGGDARQTNDGNLIEGVDSVDGVAMTGDDIDRLTNTSDLYGLLGKNGALSNLGVDAGYLPTDYIGDAFDLVGMGGRPLENIAAAKDTFEKRIEGVAESDIPYAEKNAIIKSAEEQFYTDTARYDERFFDLTTERSSNTTMPGIWEKNPYASSGVTMQPDGLGSSETDAITKAPSDNESPASDPIDDALKSIESELGGTGTGTGTGPDSEFVSEDELLGEGDLIAGGESELPWIEPQGDFTFGGLPANGAKPEPENDYVPMAEQTEQLSSTSSSSPQGGTPIADEAFNVGVEGDPELLELFKIASIKNLPPMQRMEALKKLQAKMQQRRTAA